ncbi:MAG: dienelactone hydrolase family-domain-containing protein [Monoraphidium minutum]|nr:MAG: dienelactone hydrolase family-domain-containing protein [Monoraphidium minutum]
MVRAYLDPTSLQSRGDHASWSDTQMHAHKRPPRRDVGRGLTGASPAAVISPRRCIAPPAQVSAPPRHASQSAPRWGAATAGCPCNAAPRPRASQAATAAVVAGALLAAVPASIAIDAAIDRATDRVGRVANTATPGGTRLYVARPQGAPPQDKGWPALVLVHQIFGLQPREAGLCDDLAASGFVAAAPDTFGGAATHWIPRALAVAYPRALKAGATWGVDEVADAVEWLKQQPGVDPGRVAVAGFCYGGASALRCAAAHPAGAAAVGVFYGRPLAGDGAAGGYRGLAGAGVPVYAVFGGRDSQFSPAAVDAFEAELAAAGVACEFKRYPSQGHAFIADVEATRRPGSDSADAWGGFLDFLRRRV